MISVAMATYNGEKYIKEQINSILQQTYQDFEIVICDDCSRDKTREILINLAEQDKRIKAMNVARKEHEEKNKYYNSIFDKSNNSARVMFKELAILIKESSVGETRPDSIFHTAFVLKSDIVANSSCEIPLLILSNLIFNLIFCSVSLILVFIIIL